MKTFLIRPQYLEVLHGLLDKELVSKTGIERVARIRQIVHVEPWGDDRQRGDYFTISIDGEFFKNYEGNDGYHQFMREWGVAE